MSNTNIKNKPGFFSKARRFFKDMVGELKKVVWPNKKQVTNNTAIVVSFMALMVIVIAGFDTAFAAILTLIFGVAL